jgi:hypothetical protein
VVIDISQSSLMANVYDIAKCQIVQDLVKRGSSDYSPILSKLYICMMCSSLIIYMLGPAYRLFICDEDDWCAQGCYESIINRIPTAEDFIKWMKDETTNTSFVFWG